MTEEELGKVAELQHRLGSCGVVRREYRPSASEFKSLMDEGKVDFITWVCKHDDTDDVAQLMNEYGIVYPDDCRWVFVKCGKEFR